VVFIYIILGRLLRPQVTPGVNPEETEIPKV
jgi:hypothetical protein